MLQIKETVFVKSTMDWRDAPDPVLPEMAFVGRSNVGKSSLINCLIARKNLARVSKQPGKTRSINYFRIDEAFYLVDLPGYGFARASRGEKETWRKAIEGYLLNSPQLKMLFVLVDGRVGAKESDIMLVEWLRHNNIPHQIVATKIDKVKSSQMARQQKDIQNALGLGEDNRLIAFSAITQAGRGALTGLMGRILSGG
ncbi:MAG: YihA family ribosome biogenesis GTP-binding protein [Calditrichaeota bacterium]|nr:YihA family ribosome biogenesis GTP-binding protein [Calditrichota bacterium]